MRELIVRRPKGGFGEHHFRYVVWDLEGGRHIHDFRHWMIECSTSAVRVVVDGECFDGECGQFPYMGVSLMMILFVQDTHGVVVRSSVEGEVNLLEALRDPLDVGIEHYADVREWNTLFYERRGYDWVGSLAFGAVAAAGRRRCMWWCSVSVGLYDTIRASWVLILLILVAARIAGS